MLRHFFYLYWITRNDRFIQRGRAWTEPLPVTINGEGQSKTSSVQMTSAALPRIYHNFSHDCSNEVWISSYHTVIEQVEGSELIIKNGYSNRSACLKPICANKTCPKHQ